MTVSRDWQLTNLTELPPEILLNTIPQIPYDPRNLSALRLTAKCFNQLVTNHEHSLVSAIKAQQFGPDTLRLFPSLPHSFKGLSILHKRLKTITDVHTHWLKITHNGPELHWLRNRWEAAHKAGMLLLYRLYDTKSHSAKIETLQELPATSLACLIFKLYSSIKILRLYGPEPINLSYAAGVLTARSDVELAFEETLLIHGPDLCFMLLHAERPKEEQRQWAVDALREEIAGMEERQQPLPDGAPKPPTLISVLRRAFAARVACHVAEVTSKMWEVLSGTIFDTVDDDMMISIVNGQEVARKSMRRMGF